jgi:hypothetical protein
VLHNVDSRSLYGLFIASRNTALIVVYFFSDTMVQSEPTKTCSMTKEMEAIHYEVVVQNRIDIWDPR